MPARLPLHDVHQAEGARLDTSSCGWLLPVDYGDAVGEHRAARERAGIVDRSAVGKVVVTGRDRASFLQGMLTNDVKALAPGQGCPAAFLDAHGKVMALLAVLVLEDRLLLEVPPGRTDALLQMLDRFLISEKAVLEGADAAWVVLAVEGPEAGPVAERVAGRRLDLAPHAHVEAVAGGVPARVVRRDDLGLPGYHWWTAPDHGATLWRALRAAGAAPVGLSAWDVLRVEAGQPLYGRDVDDTVILPETRLEHLVHYGKGCYIGQEVVARVKYRGHVNRALCGLLLAGTRVPPAGAAVVAGGKDVGRVTSAVHSHALGVAVALGYVRREHLEPGTLVSVRDGDDLLPARVAGLPLVGPP